MVMHCLHQCVTVCQVALAHNCTVQAVLVRQMCDMFVFSRQGVQEHTFFFKSIANANALRQRVCECFERAALPQTSQKVSCDS